MSAVPEMTTAERLGEFRRELAAAGLRAELVDNVVQRAAIGEIESGWSIRTPPNTAEMAQS